MRELEREGKGASETGGGARLLWRARGVSGRWQWVITTGVKEFNSMDSLGFKEGV
jgi:hypothetical protein